MKVKESIYQRSARVATFVAVLLFFVVSVAMLLVDYWISVRTQDLAAYVAAASAMTLEPSPSDSEISFARQDAPSQVQSAAIDELEQRAASGDPQAAFELGNTYRLAVETEAMAAGWYLEAADQGYAPAQHRLAAMYEQGRGVPQNDAEAFRWYYQAARNGYLAARYNVGVMYSKGRGVSQNDEKAVDWLRKAVEHGDSKAMNNLGVMYFHGRGVPQSDERAAALYREAAEQGRPTAQHNLGMLYVIGRGVKPDYELAYMWLDIAASQADAENRELSAAARRTLALRMTADQMAAAGLKAAEWREQHSHSQVPG